MMLMRLLVWCCTVVVFAAPAWAGTDAATAESLMRKSGLWEQLADVAPQVRTGMLATIAQSGRKPSDAEVARLSRAVDAAYSVHRLRSACLAAISRDLDKIHVAALRRWYDGPTGKTITRLEEALSRQGDQRATLAQGAALLEKMPASRRRTLDEIVLATRSAELMTELTISTTLATQQGAASVSPHAARGSASEMKAALEAQRQQFMRTFSAISLASSAVAYSSVPTADLVGYVDFLKSEAGRQFGAVGGRAFSAAILDAAAELGRALPGSRDKTNT
jgi:uncharacterized protein YfiM (DUF2279 family)